jgi:hypothetical protein
MASARLMAHIARLREVVTLYRLSREHRDCRPTTRGRVSVDGRCAICREADDVLAERGV